MSKRKTEAAPAKLRRRAENLVAKHSGTLYSPGAGEANRLIHELEVHQIELELQNEELRQARAELEANYNELYDFAPVGYFTLGRYGDIEKTNLTGAGMLGQPRSLLQGRRFAGFVTPESLPNFNGFLRRVMGGYGKEGCMVTLIKGGDTPVAAYIEATGAGPDSHCRLAVMDITSAEQARRALLETEERLRLALAASDMGVWEWESESGDIYWSPECFRIFGINCFCPTPATLAQHLHPEDTPHVRSIVSRLLADGKEQSMECRIIPPSGEAVWILVRGQGQYDKSSKLTRLIGIVQDITERKRVESSASVG